MKYIYLAGYGRTSRNPLKRLWAWLRGSRRRDDIIRFRVRDAGGDCCCGRVDN